MKDNNILLLLRTRSDSRWREPFGGNARRVDRLRITVVSRNKLNGIAARGVQITIQECGKKVMHLSTSRRMADSQLHYAKSRLLIM